MALPVILVDSTDVAASDTACSGAGPTTAYTGTAASTSGDGLTVTLDGSHDLTVLAADGSEVIYLADATAGNRNFGKIVAADNGAQTVTVNTAFGTSLTGLTWAIGGVRASVAGTANGLKLFENNAGNGDMEAGWTVRMLSGHSESIGALFNFRGSGTNALPKVLEGEAGAVTKPVLTFTTSLNGAIGGAANYITLRRFKLASTGSSSAFNVAIRWINSNSLQAYDLTFDETNAFDRCFEVQNDGGLLIQNCDCYAEYTGSSNNAGVIVARVWDTDTVRIIGNKIKGGYRGVYLTGANFGRAVISHNVFDNQEYHKIHVDTNHESIEIHDNVFYDTASGGDGVYIGDAADLVSLAIYNNVFDTILGYAVNANTAVPVTSVHFIGYNAFRNISTGQYSATVDVADKVGVGDVSLAVTPFTNAAAGDFSLNTLTGGGAACRGAGYPQSIPG